MSYQQQRISSLRGRFEVASLKLIAGRASSVRSLRLRKDRAAVCSFVDTKHFCCADPDFKGDVCLTMIIRRSFTAQTFDVTAHAHICDDCFAG
ncbi:Hypothetical protein SMAX5B_003246 [Scophthalmus maximus]|uniref:Uncharacterized protein n=1 Tax=Scophthalmus maximus TaxID=52904 RepID=A0A2U9BE57_SCOMX|nr:Hypothetical protein SMAX5B_003246 [Scophthalmus maximus]